MNFAKQAVSKAFKRTHPPTPQKKNKKKLQQTKQFHYKNQRQMKTIQLLDLK